MRKYFLIKYTLSILGGLLLFSFSPLHAQLNIGGEPYSFGNELRDQLPIETMPPIDLAQLKREDERDARAGLPFRFGKSFPVYFNLQNSGEWTTLNNGDRVWRLMITCPDAKSINLVYDHFWLPKGSVFYLYSPDKTEVLGGFTAKNNKGVKDERNGFATSFIKQDQVILEYYEPAQVQGDGVISISKVIHGYQAVSGVSRDFGDGGGCQVNINCAEGNNWQEEKRSVAILVIGGNRGCTGSLINNTCGDFDPLFLTADHCFNGSGHDAVSAPGGTDLMFLWDYESVGCANPDDEPSFLTTSGATVLANDDRATSSDFALLRLTEDPANLGGFVPYYTGWDRTGILTSGGVGIHHPRSDIKKIATHSMVPTGECAVAHGMVPRWLEVFWDATFSGQSVTEGGSSGSPLFDHNHRVIGQLAGDNSCTENTNCSDPAMDEALYGAMSWSWNNGGAMASTRRLSDWLDACGSGNTVLDGISGCATNHNISNPLYWAIEYEASNMITADNEVYGATNSGFGARYDAGNMVLLTTDFVAHNGSLFTALIDGCGNADPRAQEEIIYTSAGKKDKDGLVNTPGIVSSIYPNPTKDQVTIEYTINQKGTVMLEVYSARNQQVFKSKIAEHNSGGTYQYELSLNDLPDGIYFTKIYMDGVIDIQRIVKAH